MCIGHLCETRDYGRYYTTCYSIVSLGFLTGAPIAGVLVDACGGGYLGVIVWTGGCYLRCAIALAYARILVVGWKVGVKF